MAAQARTAALHPVSLPAATSATASLPTPSAPGRRRHRHHRLSGLDAYCFLRSARRGPKPRSTSPPHRKWPASPVVTSCRLPAQTRQRAQQPRRPRRATVATQRSPGSPSGARDSGIRIAATRLLPRNCRGLHDGDRSDTEAGAGDAGDHAGANRTGPCHWPARCWPAACAHWR